MASLVQNAVRIKQTFSDILSAIKTCGGEPLDEEDVSTYADAIDALNPSLTPATVVSSGYTCWYGGYCYVKTWQYDSWFTPTTHYSYPSNDPITSRSDSSKNKLTIQRSGTYLVCMSYCDKGTAQTSGNVAFVLYVNGSQRIGNTSSATYQLSINKGITTLNAGDELTLKFNPSTSGYSARNISGSVILQRIGDV